MRRIMGSLYENEADVVLDTLRVLTTTPGVRRVAVDDQWDQFNGQLSAEWGVDCVRAVGGVTVQGQTLYPDFLCEMTDAFADATGIRVMVIEAKSGVHPCEMRPVAQACNYAHGTLRSGRPVDVAILLPVDMRFRNESSARAEILAHHCGVWYGQLFRHRGGGQFRFADGSVSVFGDENEPAAFRFDQPDGPAIACETTIAGGSMKTRLLFTPTETIVTPRLCRRKRGSR